MITHRLTAVLDACILCSPLKRQLILSLAEVGLVQVRWSDEILTETRKAINIMLTKKGHDNPVECALQVSALLNRAFIEATVASYAHHGKGIGSLPDEGDRHVIAVAIKSKADIIVTENLKDFPRKTLSKYEIKAKSSDDFIADVIDLDPALAVQAIKHMRQRLHRPDLGRPGKTPEAFFLDLEKTGLKQAANQLRNSVNPI